MLNLPKVPSVSHTPMPKMGLLDYARFSELCLRSNPAITPENCLTKRASEKLIKKPFVLGPR
ncbi:MAG: hypothetical protein HQ523_01155 [Lentisphaerae bacterium]|nr:hypothetical protein [Lentisphaerota bacterium]